jgi:hypothetical protein
MIFQRIFIQYLSTIVLFLGIFSLSGTASLLNFGELNANSTTIASQLVKD